MGISLVRIHLVEFGKLLVRYLTRIAEYVAHGRIIYIHSYCILRYVHTLKRVLILHDLGYSILVHVRCDGRRQIFLIRIGKHGHPYPHDLKHLRLCKPCHRLEIILSVLTLRV